MRTQPLLSFYFPSQTRALDSRLVLPWKGQQHLVVRRPDLFPARLDRVTCSEAHGRPEGRQSIFPTKVSCKQPCQLEKEKIRTIARESGKRLDRTSSTTYVGTVYRAVVDLSDNLITGPDRLIDRFYIGSLESQWDGVPGRAEPIRLVFEYTGTPYEEVKDNATLMTRIIDPETVGIPQNLWPPALELPNGKWLSQTGLIINYLSPKLGLAGYAKDDANLDEDEKTFLNAKNTQLALTALDLLVEVSVV